jgi:hypothetical protein
MAIVRSRYHETSSEDNAGWKRLTECAGVIGKMWKISDGDVIKRNYEFPLSFSSLPVAIPTALSRLLRIK